MAYIASDAAKAHYESYLLVSRIRNASYGNGLFKSSPAFIGLTQADCVMKVLDDAELTASFLAEADDYRENIALAKFLLNLRKKTGHDPKELTAMPPKVQELYAKQVAALV